MSDGKPNLDPKLLRLVRQDIQSMHAYAIQESAGLIKLDAMENPHRLPPALQAELGARLGALALNRYPDGRVNDLRNALAADLIPARQRGKYLAFFSGTWAATSLLGPLVGGLLVDGPGWRWIFWFNVPTALLAIALLSALRRPATRIAHTIDVLGVLLLIGGVGPLVLAVSLGGRMWAWASWQSAALLAASALLIPAFAWRQLRAPEPLLPMPVRAACVLPRDDPAGTMQSVPPLIDRSRSLSHATDSLIPPQASITLTYWPASEVDAEVPPGAQLNPPDEVVICEAASIVTSANGMW